MKRFLFLASALAWLTCFGSAAKADPSPTSTPSWTYNFTPNNPSNQVLADPRSDGGTPGGVNLTNEPTKTATGSSDIVVTNLHAFSAAPNSAPDTFGASSGNWSAGLVLTDSASGQSANMTFTGKFGGTFSASNANITSTLNPETQQVTLGGNTYSVSLTSYTPPGPPGASNSGSISAHVTVTPGVTIQGVPEPSTLLLSGLGLSSFGLVSWRKRRQRLAMA